MSQNPIHLSTGETDIYDDPVFQHLLTGRAATFEAAEELYLNESLPEVYRLLASPASNDELAQHPLFRLLYFRGSRGWEDSL